MERHETATSGTNESSTCTESGTRLTQRRSPPVRSSKIYFIASEEAIKIGCSKNPEMRLGELQVGAEQDLVLLATVDGNRQSELDLHRRFAHLRLRGEWFMADQELLDFIGNLQSGTAPLAATRPQRDEFSQIVAGLIRKRPSFSPEKQHIVSNIVEQIQNLPDYVRPAWANDPRQTLPYQLKKSLDRLSAAM